MKFWFVNYNKNLDALSKEAVDSVFLSNHDQGRSGAFFGNQIEKTKLMGSVLLLAPGRVYVYYGEEIGMISKDGSNSDPHKRIAMYWSNKSVYEGWCYNTPENIKIDEEAIDLIEANKDNENIKEINAEYRNIDSATDVLSFPQFDDPYLQKYFEKGVMIGSLKG